MAAALVRGVGTLPVGGLSTAVSHRTLTDSRHSTTVRSHGLPGCSWRYTAAQAGSRIEQGFARCVDEQPPVSLRPRNRQRRILVSASDASTPPISGGGHAGLGGGAGKGYGGGGGRGGSGDGSESSNKPNSGNPFALLFEGWRERVEADPQFPFKVLTEQIIGVTASVLGDMAGRPNFGLSELDFVFSTLIVGSILNFSLMYLLAPTLASAGATSLPWIFASCPAGHMFEPGNFGLLQRSGTFVFKGVQFAVIGFAAGLLGTGMTNLLLKLRKKMDPDYEGNSPPPLVLNAGTWALHMGLSSNVRYQSLNGIEFLLSSKLNPNVFKSLIFVLRTLNNVGGGASFSILAKMTGSQKGAAAR